MYYDISLIEQLCNEIGFLFRKADEQAIEIKLAPAAQLIFANIVDADDCMCMFKNSLWHTHGNFLFSDKRGYFIEIDYLDVLLGLKDGSVLICELYKYEQCTDRWLIHRDYNDEFSHMGTDERIVVHRANISSPLKTKAFDVAQ